MKFHLLKFNNKAILDQLLLEERLLRGDDRNWCIINNGSPDAIVMGISSSMEKFVDRQKASEKQIPIIRRYSGGGTVFVDYDTIFITFIINKQVINSHLFPEKIHKWSEKIYKDVFTFEGFRLRENDYVIFDKKFGGNAQYIQKKRCVHHTTFLWDFKSENMNCLLFPPKTPNYRESRDHLKFLTKIKSYFAKKDDFIKKVVNTLNKHFSIEEVKLEDLKLNEKNRISSKRVI